MDSPFEFGLEFPLFDAPIFVQKVGIPGAFPHDLITGLFVQFAPTVIPLLHLVMSLP